MTSIAEKKAVREPWDDIERQRAASLTGIWLFSASEFLFFGGLFVVYSVYFYLYPEGFLAAGAETGLAYGLPNTVVLLCSSACVAIAAATAKWPSYGRLSRAFIGITILLGLAFLAIKGAEYFNDVKEGLVPGPGFTVSEQGAQIFFAFYWAATGLHTVHVTVGLGLLLWLAISGMRDPAWYSATPAVNVIALYWGFVDIIWTLLFVLVYLPGRAS
jgi:cytochrome c oxidase subunit 3